MTFLGVNWPGVSAAASVLVKPKAPALVVPDISYLNWAAFKARGITGVVLDKDNCLTKPQSDHLVPRLQPSWDALLNTFGPRDVLIVSNSAGTRKDSLLLQAESVSRNLGVPVLVHSSPKPSMKCARSILAYFSPPPPRSNPSLFQRMMPARESPGAVVWPRKDKDGTSTRSAVPRLLVVGDRLTTDVVLAHHLASLPLPSPPPPSPSAPSFATSSSLPDAAPRIEAVPILTTAVHGPEGLGTTTMRAMEGLVLRFRRPSPSIETTQGWESCLDQDAVVAASIPSLPLLQRLNPLRLLPPIPYFWFNTPDPKPNSFAYIWQETFSASGKTANFIARRTEWLGRKLREWSIKYELAEKLKRTGMESLNATGRTADGISKITEWVGRRVRDWAQDRGLWLRRGSKG